MLALETKKQRERGGGREGGERGRKGERGGGEEGRRKREGERGM